MQNSDALRERLRAAREFRPRAYLALAFGAYTIGWIRRDLAEWLRVWPEVFEFSDKNICLRPVAEADLSAALAEVARVLAREGHIQGWRNETYAIRANEGEAVLFHLERAATRFFGLTSSAIHLNGFALETEISTIWIARRSATKAIDAGMLDTLVAGGVPSGEDALQTLLRECGEEAGIPSVLAAKARATGMLRVCREVPEGLHIEILYMHDLPLAADFTPRNTDGEVSEFLSIDPAALLERIAHGEMTVEAGLVAVDFLLRHELVRDPDGTIRAAVELCRYAPDRGNTR